MEEEEVRSNEEMDCVVFNETQNRRRRSLKEICAKITVEPMLFLHMVGFSFTLVSIQNLYIDRICESKYTSDASINCANLSEFPNAEASVQKIATQWSTYRSLIEAGVPVVFAVFVGPWSDIHGSKPPMLLALGGYLLNSVLLLILSGIKGLDPSMLLIAAVPLALTGGVISFVVSAFRYVATNSSTESRTFRIAIAECTWFIGMPIGLLGSAFMLKSIGYKPVFATSAVCFALSLGYAIFFIKSDKQVTDDSSCTNMIKDMLNTQAVEETFVTVFGARTGYHRLWLWLLLCTIFLKSFAQYGTAIVAYLYTRKVFQWDVEEFSQYSTFDSLIGITGTTAVAVLGLRLCNMSDSLIGTLSAISCLAGPVIWAFSSYTALAWMMYLGSTAQMISGLISIVSRSMLSKVVKPDEIGKVFSVLGAGEAVMPLITTPIYNFFYGNTVDTFPGAVYCFNSSISLVILSLFLYLSASTWRERTRSSIVDSEDE